MKKTYKNPTMVVVKIQTMQMMAASQLRVGNEYGSGDAVLGREFDFDDEE